MTAFLVAWSVYGFTLNPFPLAEAVRGIEAIAAMSGQPNYFMGEIPRTANWYFFPVMLAVKTPIPLLILIACGVAAALLRPSFDRRVLAVAAAAGAILAVGMLSRIDLGLRHVLAIYPLLALVAATGARALFVRGVYLSAAAALLLSWLLLDVARAHPDYLAYFNEPARPHAAYFSADSDFDWGQDAERLAAALEERGIRRVSVAMQSTARLERLGLIEARPLWPGDRPTGWVAVSIGRILHDRVTRPYTGLRWLLCQRPVA